MICSLNDLKCKEVINVETGEKIGFIDDIEFEPENGTVIAFIIRTLILLAAGAADYCGCC